MNEMTRPITHRLAHLTSALALAALAACGGGGDGNGDLLGGGGAVGGGGGNNNGGGGGGALSVTCDTTHYQAGAVQTPSAAQMTAYAGTYKGAEGDYGPNPGDPFVKSADVVFVLGSNGSVSYNGASYTATSICIDKAAGPVGTVMYVEAGTGHFDISNQEDPTLGSAWGVSPTSAKIFTGGKKQ